ncbi:MAG: PhoH family protein [Proteobacteria bacterium]|nr:PhoH family protein [Pseudomonadota bacterium]MBU1545394.1 PhoH family protein [Pseudomonadota bacterium]MBU2618066.1 PhoH family protein [Pseudomonadota bacterium]
MIKRDIALADNTTALLLYGDLNKNLAVLEEGAGVTIQARGSQLTVSGPKHEVELTVSAIDKLQGLVRAGYPVYPSDVAYALRILQASPKANLKEIFLDKVYITAEQKVISPKSINQKLYIDNIRTNDIVFGIGPAGTGKTYLAVAMAVSAFVGKQVRSIILARPAVEAGERLGFLPGDLAQKVNPYLRPLHDALNAMLGRGKVADLIEEGSIEIAPLAFMRGRTLSNAFVILDEAQNTTHEQMKMFLTRLGFNSQAVITGDITQIDLPDRRQSGLIEAARILKDIKGIAFNQFSEVDVVRHRLVQEIIRAYAAKETLPPPRRTTHRKH